jgi:hypothetical protein
MYPLDGIGVTAVRYYNLDATVKRTVALPHAPVGLAWLAPDSTRLVIRTAETIWLVDTTTGVSSVLPLTLSESESIVDWVDADHLLVASIGPVGPTTGPDGTALVPRPIGLDVVDLTGQVSATVVVPDAAIGSPSVYIGPSIGLNPGAANLSF